MPSLLSSSSFILFITGQIFRHRLPSGRLRSEPRSVSLCALRCLCVPLFHPKCLVHRKYLLCQDGSYTHNSCHPTGHMYHGALMPWHLNLDPSLSTDELGRSVSRIFHLQASCRSRQFSLDFTSARLVLHQNQPCKAHNMKPIQHIQTELTKRYGLPTQDSTPQCCSRRCKSQPRQWCSRPRTRSRGNQPARGHCGHKTAATMTTRDLQPPRR